MSSENIVRITTEDTKKTYEFPNKGNPELWEVTLCIEAISKSGNPHYGDVCKKRIHIERETLESAGLLPRRKERKDEVAEETPEELILRLLEHVGVYPNE